jgi:hypothetical protein
MPATCYRMIDDFVNEENGFIAEASSAMWVWGNFRGRRSHHDGTEQSLPLQKF